MAVAPAGMKKKAMTVFLLFSSLRVWLRFARASMKTSMPLSRNSYLEAMKKFRDFFELQDFRVIIEKKKGGRMTTEATIKMKVGKELEHTASIGDGPVNALDSALRKALKGFYPELAQMRLTDYKVRVLDEKQGTAARVRVLIQSQDKTDSWWTIGVSENIIDASWQALVDSIEYKLLKDSKRR